MTNGLDPTARKSWSVANFQTDTNHTKPLMLRLRNAKQFGGLILAEPYSGDTQIPVALRGQVQIGSAVFELHKRGHRGSASATDDCVGMS